MIRNALDNFQITPNLGKDVIYEMPLAKFAAASDGKLFVRWVITALVMVVLLIQTHQVLANPEDYTQWGLPEGAKARIGKGTFTDMQWSSDGTRLAIASSAGVWLYDGRTGDEIALITENAALIFTPDGGMLAVATSRNVHLWDLVDIGKQVATFPKRVADFDGTCHLNKTFTYQSHSVLRNYKVSRPFFRIRCG